MSRVDLEYLIVEAGIGGPPQGNPVLANEDGGIIPPDDLLVFNKSDHPNMKKTDHFCIKFKIKEFDNSLLRFPPVSNMANAMWAQPGTNNNSCPRTACEMKGIFYSERVHPQGKWLEVVNMDMQVETFWFALNLVPKTDPASTNYVQVDPGGDNRNNGAPGFDKGLNYFTAIALGFGAGLVAYFGAQLFLNG